MSWIRIWTYVTLGGLLACGGKQQAPAPEPESHLPAPPAETAAAEAATPEAQALVAIPDQPQPEPESVLMLVSLPNPVDTMSSLERVARAMGQPVVAGEPSALIGDLSAQLLGARIAGLDLRQPLHVLMLSPDVADHPFVLVGTVASRPALLQSITGSQLETVIHRGRVAVGHRDALTEVAPHALSALALAPAPQQLELTVRLSRIQEILGPRLEEQIDQIELMFDQIEAQTVATGASAAETEATRESHRSMRQLLALARAVLQQGSELRLTLQPAGAPTVELTLVAEPDTPMRNVFAAIGASDMSLVRLHGDAEILFGGRFDVEALPEEIRRELSGRLWPGGAEAYTAMQQLYGKWYELTQGEMVIAVGGTDQAPPWMVVRQKLERPDAAMALLRKMGARHFGAPGELRIDYKRNALRHRGVVADRLTVTPTAKMTPEARAAFDAQYGPGGLIAYVTVVGDQMMSAAGENARPRIEAMIDEMKEDRIPALPEPTAAALAESRRRAETFVLVLDAGRILGPTAPQGRIALGVGFTDESMTLRFSLPAEPARITRMR